MRKDCAGCDAEMSGDNWKACQVCHNLPVKYRGGISHLYGKLPEEEYLALKNEHKELASIQTVREDYEFVFDHDGTLSVSYFAKCENCGVEWKYAKTKIEPKTGGMLE